MVTQDQKAFLRITLARRQGIPMGVMMLYDIHHMHLHNTLPNRRRFPQLIDSAWNCALVPHSGHMSNPAWVYGQRWSLNECERREAFLQRHECVADALNGRHDARD